MGNNKNLSDKDKLCDKIVSQTSKYDQVRDK